MAEQANIFGGVEVQLLSAPELARKLGVTDQTVYNWRDAGLACIVRDGVQRYELAAARKWQADNSSELGRGGKRANAGAKKAKVTELGRKLVTAAVLADCSGGIEAQPARSGDSPVSIDSVQDLMSQGDRAGLSPAQAKGLKETYGAAALKLEIEKELGTLVAADEVEESWAAFMKVIRTRIEGMPLKWAQSLRAVLKMDKAMFDKVVDCLTAASEQELRALAQNPLDEPQDAAPDDAVPADSGTKENAHE